MDYIIFGIGSSATLVLTGWLLRDWGPRLRDRKPAEDEILSASALVTRMAWARFCATCGMAILLCGVLVMLVTLGAAFFAPSDRAATIAVISMFGLAALLMLLWTGLYLRQFGAAGVIRQREKKAPVPEPVAVQAPQPAEDAIESGTGPAETPLPSFAETAAARGGMGRFAAFFRRDSPDGSDEDAENRPDAQDRVRQTGEPPLPVDDESAGLAGSPTDAVIAELTGAADDPDAKKLSPTDPLVTSVRQDQADTSPEDGVTAEMRGAELGEVQDLAPDSSPGETGGETADDVPTSEHNEQDVALSQLRRRRLSRLSRPSDQD